MTALVAVSLSVPAFGGPDNPVSETFKSAKSTAKKALKKAKEANKKAKQAQKSADNAQLSADGAASAAATADSKAEAAQSAADAAQATADSKYGQVDVVYGDTSDNDASDSKLVFANCPSGFDITGGGFAMAGAAPGNVAPSLSDQYLNSWTVRAVEVNATASNWTVQAAVNCIAP